MHSTTSLDVEASTPLDQCAISGRAVHLAFKLSVFADLTVCEKLPRYLSVKPLSKRGYVTTFSARSRKRMLEMMAKWRNQENLWFATLTYPGQFDFSSQRVKEHLANLRRALQRRHPGHAAVWRIEWKTRKTGPSKGEVAPHYHLLISGVDHEVDPLFRQWLAHTWTRIVTGSEAASLLQVHVEVAKSRKHAARYVSKYCAKPVIETSYQLDARHGRHWGSWGDIDTTPILVLKMTTKQIVNLKRLVRSWLKSRGSKYARKLAKIFVEHGFSVFGLGDLSRVGLPGIENATITRMIFVALSEL